MIHTNRCKHCGKLKEEHISQGLPTSWAWATGYSPLFCNKDSDSLKTFTDSGLAALDAHKEELYEATQELIKAIDELDIKSGFVAKENIRIILNQIEKEK